MKKKIIKSKIKFNKNKIIDLVGISVFFFVLVFAAFSLLRKGHYIDVVVRASNSNNGLYLWEGKPPLWFLDNMKVGLEQKDMLGRSEISIVNVKTYKTSNAGRLYYVTLRLRAVYSSKLKQYSYVGQPLLVGATEVFRINDIRIAGVIHKVGTSGDSGYKSTKLRVSGYLYPDVDANTSVNIDGILNEAADMYKVGQKMYTGDGKVILEIKDVKKQRGTISFGNIYGGISRAPDPERQKVFLTVEIQSDITADGVYLFEEENIVRVNGELYLDFLTYGTPMKILKIEEIK